MKKSELLYPYGFIFSKYELEEVPDRYTQRCILEEYIYYYDSIISPSVQEVEDSFIIIHGHFVYCGDSSIVESQGLHASLLRAYLEDEDEFLDILDFIGGRFVILIGNRTAVKIYSDATGSRSVYYLVNDVAASSHVHLLADNFTCVKDVDLISSSKLACNFHYTPYTNIRSVIPNMSINLITNQEDRFFPRRDNQYKSLSEEDRFTLLENLWKKQLSYYIDNYANIVCSLTGGCDSRVSLAMARKYKDTIRFFTYTLAQDEQAGKGYFQKSLRLDKEIVEEILQDISLNHEFLVVENTRFKPTKLESVAFSKNSLISHGKYLIQYYNDSFPQEYLIHMRSNLFEIGRAFYMNIIESNSLESIRYVFNKTVLDKKNVSLSDIQKEEFFNVGLSTLAYDKVYDYHLLDLFYWENRMGRWFSEVLNETDAAFDTFLPFNMRAMIDISLSFSLSQRESDFVFRELINRNFSVLNFYGINSRENLYELYNKNNLSHDFIESQFVLFSAERKVYDKCYSTDNTIFIPYEELEAGSFAEVNIEFSRDKGVASIALLNEYYSEKGAEYIQYEVYRNNTLLLVEDISKWTNVNYINIMNMVKGEVISIRVRALRRCKAKSWEKASRLRFISYEEDEQKKDSEVDITYTSPHSYVNVRNKVF